MLKFLRQAKIPLRVAAAIALAYLLYVFLARHNTEKRFSAQRTTPDAAATSAFDAAYGGTDVKILQFYARDGVLNEGKSTLICYGVLNAKSMTIEPPLSDVGVSLNRCVEAAPKRNTTYVLTAEGENGKTVSASFTIRLQADPDSLPRITSFGIAKHVVEKGRHIYTLAFVGYGVSQGIVVLPCWRWSNNEGFRRIAGMRILVTGGLGTVGAGLV